MSECEPCKKRQTWLNSLCPGLGDRVANFIERARRMMEQFEPTASWFSARDSRCQWNDEGILCHFQWSQQRGELLLCRTHTREYDDIYAQIEEE